MLKRDPQFRKYLLYIKENYSADQVEIVKVEDGEMACIYTGTGSKESIQNEISRYWNIHNSSKQNDAPISKFRILVDICFEKCVIFFYTLSSLFNKSIFNNIKKVVHKFIISLKFVLVELNILQRGEFVR